MNAMPLRQIGWFGRGHLSALWWIGLAYRRPRVLETAIKDFSRGEALATMLKLFLHSLPYQVIFIALGRWMVFAVLGLPPDMRGLPSDPVGFLFKGAGIGIGVGVLLLTVLGGPSCLMRKDPGVTGWFSAAMVGGLVLGIASGIGYRVGGPVSLGAAGGFATGVASGIMVQIGIQNTGRVFGIGVGIGVLIVAGAIGTQILTMRGETWIVGDGIATGITSGIAFLLTFFRLYYAPLHLVFLWPKLQGRLYPWHPVAWDDVCLFRWPGLHRLLVAFTEHDRLLGWRELARLTDHNRLQRAEVLRAVTILFIREAGSLADLREIDRVLAPLPEGARGYLSQVPRVRELARNVCHEAEQLALSDRALLREVHAGRLSQRIAEFREQVAGLTEPLASELRKAGAAWLARAEELFASAQAARQQNPHEQVFRAGDPVDRRREAFVRRELVLGDLDRQLSLATGCPGLVLYGRRRMGKTTLLRNLVGLVPDSLVPVAVSLQDPRAASSLSAFITYVAEQVSSASRSTATGDGRPANLEEFFQLLDRANAALDTDGRRLLLALDEFEVLDEKLRRSQAEGGFPLELLATLRESIQSHRRIIWVFAGSHEITELTADWTSYLVSARTVEIPLFTPEETRLLLTDPLLHSPLWGGREDERPRLAPEFWGEKGIERIHAEAGGWPHLVQLLAEKALDRVNEEGRDAADAVLFERAIGEAVVAGHNVLHQLLLGECRTEGEREYLEGFRRRDVQALPDDEAVLRTLRRRLLVVEDGGRLRLRVPLMQRWLRERG
jgi:hypothetical protein